MWGCYIKHRSALCNLIFSTELKMKRAQKLAVTEAAAKLSCAVLLPGWEPEYDFISINHGARLIRNNQIICQKAFRRMRENLAACSWIFLLISPYFSGTSRNISSRFPLSQSRASAAFLHFSSWNELWFQILRGTGELSESSDSTQKNTNPPWTCLPNIWWETERGKVDFHALQQI